MSQTLVVFCNITAAAYVSYYLLLFCLCVPAFGLGLELEEMQWPWGKSWATHATGWNAAHGKHSARAHRIHALSLPLFTEVCCQGEGLSLPHRVVHGSHTAFFELVFHVSLF